MTSFKESIYTKLKEQTGHVGFYYKNLATGDELG
jgi:hypothetical protein